MTVNKMIKFLEEFEEPEQKFKDFAHDINGLVGPGSIALLNGCCNLIEDTKKCVYPEKKYFYLEVGSFQGMSILGASMDNEVQCYGVENFAEEFKDNWEKFEPAKRSNRTILHSNLDKYDLKENVWVFEEDYRSFFANRNNIDNMKAQVYLYDGPHAYAHQIAGLLLAMPLLANHAIVFIDDYKCENVPRSIERVLAMNNGYVREIKHWIDPYESFREGFVALEFKRNG